MTRALCIVAAAALAVAWPAAAAARTIYVRNVSSAVTDSEITNALPAIQDAVSLDFAPVWGQDAQLVFIGRSPVPSRGETLTVTDRLVCAPNCLGYHEVWRGVPRGLALADDSWPLTLSHELFEMLADPYTNVTAKVGSRFYLQEVCDPVEQQSYTRPGADGAPVTISDFVTPLWFVAAAKLGPYDFLDLVRSPLLLLSGGYISWWQDGSWHQDLQWERHRAP